MWETSEATQSHIHGIIKQIKTTCLGNVYLIGLKIENGMWFMLGDMWWWLHRRPNYYGDNTNNYICWRQLILYIMIVHIYISIYL